MPLSPRNRKKPGLRENDDNAQFSLCCTHRLSRMTIARSSSGFFSSTLSFRGIFGEHEENLLQTTSHARSLGPDSVRHKPNNDTVFTERQQNSRKEITI